MERKYLAATIALVATYVVFSQAFRAENMGRAMHTRTYLVSELKCATKTIETKLASKMPFTLRPDSPERAQLLAEMSLPAARAQAQLDAAQATLQAEHAKLQAAQARLAAAQRSHSFATLALPAALIAPAVPAIAVTSTSWAAVAPRAAKWDCPEMRRAQQAAEKAQRAAERARAKAAPEKIAALSMESIPANISVQVSVPAAYAQPGQVFSQTFTVRQTHMLQRQVQMEVMRELRNQVNKISVQMQ